MIDCILLAINVPRFWYSVENERGGENYTRINPCRAKRRLCEETNPKPKKESPHKKRPSIPTSLSLVLPSPITTPPIPSLHILHLTLRLPLPHHTPPTLPPQHRQHNRTRRKKHTQPNTQPPNPLRHKTLLPPTPRPPRQPHDRAPLPARRKRHGERPRAFGAAGGFGAVNCAAVEVRQGPAEEDGDG